MSVVSKEVYDGLTVETVFFDDDITTLPEGYSGCRIGTIEIYTEDNAGNPMPAGQCFYEDEDDVVYNWYTMRVRGT